MDNRVKEAQSLFTSLTEAQQADIMALLAEHVMQEKTRSVAATEREAVKHGNH